jgi:hypothetical protein
VSFTVAGGKASGYEILLDDGTVGARAERVR